MLYQLEDWQDGAWQVLRRGISDHERQELLDANLADGNVFSQDDPTPDSIPAPPKTVFRFMPPPTE